jgi:hypothetical protein
VSEGEGVGEDELDGVGVGLTESVGVGATVPGSPGTGAAGTVVPDCDPPGATGAYAKLTVDPPLTATGWAWPPACVEVSPIAAGMVTADAGVENTFTTGIWWVAGRCWTRTCFWTTGRARNSVASDTSRNAPGRGAEVPWPATAVTTTTRAIALADRVHGRLGRHGLPSTNVSAPPADVVVRLTGRGFAGSL